METLELRRDLTLMAGTRTPDELLTKAEAEMRLGSLVDSLCSLPNLSVTAAALMASRLARQIDRMS